MAGELVSRRTAELFGAVAPVMRFLTESRYARRSADPGICDFVAGNPQELPMSSYVEALRRAAEPRHKGWFGYEPIDPESAAAVVPGLRERTGVAFEPDDVLLTTGAFGALAVTMRAICDPGDEVVFVSPPWFFYELLIMAAGGTPVRATSVPPDFDLPVQEIAAAVTSATRAVVVNTPNNPTGRIYPPTDLQRLGEVLETATRRAGRPVYLISDESYARILFDGNHHQSPAAHYPRTLLIYTYGKTLLTPGQRLGYVALPPEMQGRDEVRQALFLTQVAAGYAFPNRLLCHALPELEGLSMDLEHLEEKRDRMVSALRDMGYDLHVPEGTFYLLPRSPIADDLEFCDLLADQDVFVLPGTFVELPGHFRISLTANDDMLERSLAGFAAAMDAAKGATRSPHGRVAERPAP